MKPLLLAIVFTAISTTPRVSIKVTPQVVMAGGSIRVTCKVPRDPRNRLLEVGVYPYIAESRQINGDDAPITWEFMFDHIPCSVERAVCLLHAQGLGDVYQDASIQVAGCDGDQP